MKYFSEKEKKLEIALDKLKKLNLVDEEGLKNIEFLSNQKNYGGSISSKRGLQNG